MAASPRILFVIFDAADPVSLRRWALDGKLPTLQRLLATGTHGTTVAPPGMHSTAVWHSFFTGVNPARHGRHGDRQVRPGSYEVYRFLPRDTKHEPFWDGLSRAGLRVAVIDVPLVAPSERINGLHIVDWTAHEADHGFTTVPPALATEIVARFGRDPLGLCDHLRLKHATDYAGFRDALLAKIAMKVALSKHFLAQGPWDLFLTVFGESHCAGHQTWHLNDSSHPRFDAALAGKVGNPLFDVYQALDRALGDLIAIVAPGTTVIFLATHGIGPFFNGAHLLDEVLARLGHIAPPPRPSRVWAALRWSWRQLPPAWRARLTPLQKAAVDQVWPALDPRSRCFNIPNGEVYGAIRVNLAGREPRGLIQPGDEYETFCATLTRDLCALRNVDTGEPVVQRVLRTAEVYRGPYLNHLPDLLIEWSNAAPINGVESTAIGTIRRRLDSPRSGHHTPLGLFIIHGPRIPPGPIADPVSIMDLAPTVAALLGVPPLDTDGHAIEYYRTA